MNETLSDFLHGAVRFLAAAASRLPTTDGTDCGRQAYRLSKSDIEALPHVKVTVSAHSEPETFEGVLLRSVLEKGGVVLGETLRGKAMASCLVVEAADGYRVVIALPELDEGFTDKQVVLAFFEKREAVDDKEGPYHIVIPNEKRMARWVRQVTTLKIVNVN